MWPFQPQWTTYRWSSAKGAWVKADKFEDNPGRGIQHLKTAKRAPRRPPRRVSDPEHRKILENLQGHFAKDERAARQLWKEFREEPVGRSRRINIRWPKALAVMGSAQLIAYATTHGGKLRLYEHEFAPGSQPLLCAGKEPGQLFLIGQGFKVNAHGIVDIDRHGRRKRYTPRLKVVRRR